MSSRWAPVIAIPYARFCRMAGGHIGAVPATVAAAGSEACVGREASFSTVQNCRSSLSRRGALPTSPRLRIEGRMHDYAFAQPLATRHSGRRSRGRLPVAEDPAVSCC